MRHIQHSRVRYTAANLAYAAYVEPGNAEAREPWALQLRIVKAARAISKAAVHFFRVSRQ